MHAPSDSAARGAGVSRRTRGGQPSSIVPAAGWARRGRAKRAWWRWPRVTAKPAPGGGTCASPAGHGARPAAHARTRLAAGRRVSSTIRARPRARCPSRLRPLGGAPVPPRAPCDATPHPGRAPLLPEGRRRRRAEGLRGLNRTAARCSGRESERPRRTVRARARARALPASLLQSTPGQSPTLLPRAARLAAPNNNGARGQVAARGQRRHWPGGERGAPGLAGGRGLGRAGAEPWREAGLRRRGRGQAAVRAFVPDARSPPAPAAAPAASIIQRGSGGASGGCGQEAAEAAGTERQRLCIQVRLGSRGTPEAREGFREHRAGGPLARECKEEQECPGRRRRSCARS